MKKYFEYFMIFPVIAMTSLLLSCDTAQEREFYQLKIYRYDTADQESRLDRYLGEAYLPALHRAGISNVGVFKLRDQGNSLSNAIFLLIPFPSLKDFDRLPGLLKTDNEYLDAGSDYIESAYDRPPFTRIESILLKAFSGSPMITLPDLDSPREERVYELRSYQSATEQLFERKVEMFNEGESELFRKLGFNPVFFGEVLSSSDMPHLVYMVAHADTTTQQVHWNDFRVHPEWKDMTRIERYQNTVLHIDMYLLYPTAYSDY
jgi:hypothetical protein